MTAFLAGGIMMTYATIGLFFWRFWKKSGDRFYAMFAAAFWTLAVNQVIIVAGAETTVALPRGEAFPVYYLVRMLAFLLILLAIIDKNYSE